MKRSLLFSFFAVLMCITISHAQNSCDNLVPNGDFQSGNTGFTSGLPLACNSCTASTYCVTSNFTGKCSGWPSVFDNTFGNAGGLFLAIDGSTQGANGVWTVNAIPVVPGVTYEFSFFVSTVFGPSQQQFDLGMFINNVNVSTVNISQTVGIWTKYITTWTCPVGVTSIPLEIRQMTQGAFRDFGIDDISFRCISCEADFVFTHLDDCGLVSFADQSYGQSPVFHFWNFGDPGSGLNNTSNLMNPNHQFTECRSFDVCLTITTANGCVSESCKSIVVSDTISPIALCLGVGLEMGNNCQATVTPGLIDGGSSDNCLIQSMSVSPSILSACGEFPVTLTVTDWCGNSSTCQTTVQTAEAIPPVITCPSDILLHCDDDTDPSNTGFATATDNCTSVPIMSYSDQISGFVPCDAVIFRTWTATDSCGNEDSCIQQIVIVDNIPPIISNCPPDISVIGNFNNGVCEASVSVGIPLASDNCDSNVSLINDYNSQLDASGIYQLGSTLVTWTAIDDCGNTATCSFSVIIECEPCDSVSVLTGITGYYPFYLNADDNSGFGNHGIVNGATLTAGHDLVNNSAYLFNGSSNYIYAGQNDRGITNKVTVAAWVKTTETLNGQCVVGKYTFAGDRGYILSIGDNASNSIGQVAFSGRDGTGVYHTSGFSPARINDGEWHCVVGTAGDGVWKVYVDGILQNTAAGSSNDLRTSTEPLTIGWHTHPSYPLWMNGSIDDLLIYNRDLTEDDVRCLCSGIIPPVSTCCEDFETFCENVENAVNISVDEDSCKLTFQIGNLPECDYIEWVDWGDGNQSSGNFEAGEMPMHIYSGSGTYIISYLAIELDSSGFICFEKVLQDTIVMDCQCGCGGFTDIWIKASKLAMNQALSCGNSSPLQLTCIGLGGNYNISGNFNCNSVSCPIQQDIIWLLTGPGGTKTDTVLSFPYFNIQLQSTYFNLPGLYTLTVSGVCGSEICTCNLNFVIDCPNLCPCESVDILALDNAVAAGFATSSSTFSCDACFTPLKVSDCESVEWYINNISGNPFATSQGNSTVCHKFSGPGTYTIHMVVTRLKANGSICEIFVYSKAITVSCIHFNNCTNSRIFNPNFNIGAISGGLNSGGASEGWAAQSGNPLVMEGLPGSNDGWSVQLTGNQDSADVLISAQTVCIPGQGAVLRVRNKVEHRGDPHENLNGKHLKDWQGKQRLLLNSDADAINCDHSNCFELATIDLSPMDTGWYEMEIPIDISGWEAAVNCMGSEIGEIEVVLAFLVSSPFSDLQSGIENRARMHMDQVCFEGTVSTEDQRNKQKLRIFPNPVSQTVYIELTEAVSGDAQFKLISLTGQTLLTQMGDGGILSHTLDTSKIPPGLYFIEIIQNGSLIHAQKLVKQ